MDIITLLKKDHKVVNELFSIIAKTGEKAYKTKLSIFDKIDQELSLHVEIEETIFYPVIKKFKETKPITMESYEEHALVKQLLSQIKTMHPEEDAWQAKLTVLKELVEHHVEEEETELFPKVKKLISLEEREVLGEKMKAIKEAAGV